MGEYMSVSIVVQTFNKPDTTLRTLKSISNLEQFLDLDVLIFQDSCADSRNFEKNRTLHEETEQAIVNWIAGNESKFKSISFLQSESNLGTCASTRTAIDEGFRINKHVIFCEDDVEFSKDALNWFSYCFGSEDFSREEIWAIAGESKVFDSGSRVVEEGEVQQAIDFCEEEHLYNKYTEFNFLPSSCFATSLEKWFEFGQTRGQPNGDRDVNIRCQQEFKKSLWPVVARCKDIGMHHPDGYSVTIHKSTSKIPLKSQNIMSDDLLPRGIHFEPIIKDFANVFQKYCTNFR